MATSETAICNSALAKLGAQRILSLSDNTEAARLCNEQYAKVRDDLLRSHPWNFAIRRANLVSTGNTPAFGYAYEYQLPNDCLRILSTLSSQDTWNKEGDKIVSDDSEFAIKYIAKVTDPNQFDTNFCEVLSLKLASDISYSLVQSVTLKQGLYQEYTLALRDARSFDAQESGSVQTIVADDWLLSRL